MQRPLIDKLAIIALIASATAFTVIVAGCGEGDGRNEQASMPAHGEPYRPLASVPEDHRHPVHINRPDGTPMVDSGEVDALGRPVMVSCSSCHANLDPQPQVTSAEALDEFHQGLKYAHGELSCLSCHDPGNYDQLRLADGRSISYQQVMDLCSQCHGPQARDFRNGSHGGMTGYWDRSKGPRQRNTCTDCHDPHAPAFPTVKPVFHPRDRFKPAGAKHGEAHTDDAHKEANHE